MWNSTRKCVYYQHNHRSQSNILHGDAVTVRHHDVKNEGCTVNGMCRPNDANYEHKSITALIYIHNDAGCTCAITSRTATAQATFNKKNTFHQQLREVLYLEHSIVLCWNLDTLETRSEIPGKFRNVVLEKISWTNCVRKEELLRTVKE
jgi:hypothetical protein